MTATPAPLPDFEALARELAICRPFTYADEPHIQAAVAALRAAIAQQKQEGKVET